MYKALVPVDEEREYSVPIKAMVKVSRPGHLAKGVVETLATMPNRLDG
jgi:hypothetical protein